MIRLRGVLVCIVGLSGQAEAEGNRLLPFWGQPYPYGYAESHEGEQDGDQAVERIHAQSSLR